MAIQFFDPIKKKFNEFLTVHRKLIIFLNIFPTSSMLIHHPLLPQFPPQTVAVVWT